MDSTALFKLEPFGGALLLIKKLKLSNTSFTK